MVDTVQKTYTDTWLVEGGVKGAALSTGSQSLDSTSAKAPVLQTLPSSEEVAMNARRWGESFSPAPQVRDGLLLPRGTRRHVLQSQTSAEMVTVKGSRAVEILQA